MGDLFLQCCVSNPRGCSGCRLTRVKQARELSGLASIGVLVDARLTGDTFGLSCASSGVCAVLVEPYRLGDWRKKTLSLAQEGLMVGVFFDSGSAKAWLQAKVQAARSQVVFVQNQ